MYVIELYSFLRKLTTYFCKLLHYFDTMRYFFFILFFALSACSTNKDIVISYLNQGLESCNTEVLKLNEMYYADAEAGIMLEPSRNHLYKKNSDRIKTTSENIFLGIKEIKYSRLQNESSSNNQETEVVKAIIEYKNLLDSLFPKDSLLQHNTQNLLHLKKASINEYQDTEWNLLAIKIQLINNYVFEYFTKKMDRPRFRPNHLEGAVVSKNRYVYQNEIYEAKLYLLSIDSIAKNISVQLEGNKLEMQNGKAIYNADINSKPGLINKKGLLILKEPWSDFQYEFPFAIHYQIREK